MMALDRMTAGLNGENTELRTDAGVATSMTRSIEAQARSQRWKLQQAMEDVQNRIALLHARAAALDKSKAAVTLAQLEFERAQQLLPTSATTP
jgi:membrane fusion protein, multidrug efflux system